MAQGGLAALQSLGTQAPFLPHTDPSLDHLMAQADCFSHLVCLAGSVLDSVFV